MSKVFIWFFFLIILAFLMPTHQWFFEFFQAEMPALQGISRSNFILAVIGLLGLIILYFSALAERSKLRKELKRCKLSTSVREEVRESNTDKTE